MREMGFESNAQGSEKQAIGIIEFGRSLRFAEVNGAKVIAAVDLPESILHAMATLVDAISQEVAASRDRERQADADRPRTMCRWHLGQIADHCSPCRSEQIGRNWAVEDNLPAPDLSTPEGRRRARELFEQTRTARRTQPEEHTR